jgi:hypothetical protein
MNYEQLLQELKDAFEAFIKCCEEDEMSGGEDMWLPEDVDIMSPENVGKMIPQIKDKKYGSLGGVNISISLGMGE